jgi:hypothetical protein
MSNVANTTTINGSRGQAPVAVIAKAKPPKEPRRPRAARRQPAAITAPVPRDAGAPKSLDALLQDYHSTFQACEVGLKALGKVENSVSDEEWSAGTNEVHVPNDAAREALIDAPVATLADIVLKLRFYLEVGDYSWGDQIIKNILRDMDKVSEQPAQALSAAQPGVTCTPLDVRQTDEVEAALEQITRALDIVDELAGDILHYCKKKAEANRLAFLSDAIGKYVRDVQAILTAAQDDRRKADDVRLASRRAITMDPVLALWKEVLATENEINSWPQDRADPAESEASEQRLLDTGKRFMEAKPTTALGVAAKLKYLAIIKNHQRPSTVPDEREVEIVREAVRQLTGDPNWTIEQESAVG